MFGKSSKEVLKSWKPHAVVGKQQYRKKVNVRKAIYAKGINIYLYSSKLIQKFNEENKIGESVAIDTVQLSDNFVQFRKQNKIKYNCEFPLELIRGTMNKKSNNVRKGSGFLYFLKLYFKLGTPAAYIFLKRCHSLWHKILQCAVIMLRALT